MPNLLIQDLVRRRQFDGRFTQKQDAASNSNMEAALVMKITLTQKKNAINDVHRKVKSLCLLFCFVCIFVSLWDDSYFLRFMIS